jgi:hypothetical protein
MTVAAGGVGVLGKDWLAVERRGGDKFLIFLICSSIFLMIFHSTRGILTAYIFSSLDCCSALTKIWKDIVMGMDR